MGLTSLTVVGTATVWGRARFVQFTSVQQEGGHLAGSVGVQNILHLGGVRESTGKRT